MVLILRNLGARCILARPQERVLTGTNTHFISLIWVGAAVLAVPAIVVSGILVTVLLDANLVYVTAVLLALATLTFAIKEATYPFQEIVLTDRSLYKIRWGRVGAGWGVSDLTEIPLESVTSIEVRQFLFGPYLDFGDIVLHLAAPPDEMQLKYVPRPYRFGMLMERARSRMHLLPPITEEDVQTTKLELQGLYERQVIDQEEFESATRELVGQHIL